MNPDNRPTTAIVHDYLSQRGGAERVVLSMSRLFPEAPIYTSFYAPNHTYPEFASIDVRPSALQGKVDPDHFRRAVLRLPSAFASLDLSSFDRVLVSSSAFAHHVRHPNAAVYCYTPPRFLYDTVSYLGNRALAAALAAPFAVLRHRDRAAALAQRSYSAISRQSARRIAEAYGFSSGIIYPPLTTAHLPAEPTPLPAEARALVIARLLPYKRIDVAIRACARAGIGLTIVGEGPDEERLRQIATPSVAFLGRLDDSEFSTLYAEHSLVLVPGVEDFGYAPIEANYAGRPTVAVSAGGALETVQDGVNGQLVEGWDERAWAAAITEVLDTAWSPASLRASTERFGEGVFHRELKRWVSEALQVH